MCIFGSSKSQKRAQEKQLKLQKQAMADQKVANAEQSRLTAEANALQAQNLAFAREQADAAAVRQAEADKIAARPAAVNVAGANNSNMGELLTNGMTGDNAATDEEDVDSRRKGRRSLRIDLSAPQVAGATGINVPRG